MTMTFYDRLEALVLQVRHIAETGELERLKGAMASVQWLLVEAARTGVPAAELEPAVVAVAALRHRVLDFYEQGSLGQLLPDGIPGAAEARTDLVTVWATLPLAAAAHVAGLPDLFRSLLARSQVDPRRRGPGAALERAARAAVLGDWERAAALVRGVEPDPDLEGEDFETVTLCRGLEAVADGNLTRAEAQLRAFLRSPSPEAVTHAALLHALAALRGLDLPRPDGLLPQ